MMNTVFVRATLGLIMPFAVTPIAQAQGVADFYKGKTITMAISSAPGGGYDALGRAVTRHIGRHIPGNPNVIVQNMPGAGGIVAGNTLFRISAKDGTVMALL